nr:PDR/VanB family oxidoreductase [Kibdelosporangium sp. MJ126-NF4]CEL13128.1 Flavodoxin reductases (ferredoxin-NADPH reductases) family 1; Vanillate O-demethylase oxidoreductase [Kibdelosporangium sp. MJ126-NF4]CTQ98817.1 Flavodoxin reductases (ferredoxin-NADPH reductases) family 1; Vanillate O-demethylase oxidoreductase (EC 1.14.13.-) [Kibdelosporangium sp. MJ126-NF4]
MREDTGQVHARPPWAVIAAVGITVSSAVLFLLGMAIELAGGGRATTIGWPVVWSVAMAFFAAMSWHGRQWGRTVLAVQAGLTWLLSAELIFTQPSIVDSVTRPGLVVGITLAAAIAQTLGAATAFTPPCAAYFRRAREQARLLSPRLRKAVLTVHVVGSIAWLGIITLQSALAAVARTVGNDVALLRSLYEAQYIVDNLFLGKTSFVALFSGLALALGTPWRLTHHRWVVAKFALTVTVMILPIVVYHPVLDRGYALVLEGRTADDVSSALGFWGLLPALGVSSLMLLVAAVLSMYKPGGRTRLGRGQATATAHTPGSSKPGTPAVVSEIHEAAADVVSLSLKHPGGDALPEWSPGAHVDLLLPSGLVRQYSLHGNPDDRGSYQISVLRQPDGRGGSVEAHRLTPGDLVKVSRPRSHFDLVAAPGYLFIAGGIGITPILPMVRRTVADNADWRLLYVGRGTRRMAFVDELCALDLDRVVVVTTDNGQSRPDFVRELGDLPTGWVVYCCGPPQLVADVEAAMARERPDGRLFTERFVATTRVRGEDTPFQVELRRSGKLLDVAADRSLLDVVRATVPRIDFSCENGLCGSCLLPVLDGVPDHRDEVLNAGERHRTDVIYPCVSWSRTPRLTLDI